MIVLGISAVTNVLSVALVDDERLLAERSATGEQAHSENLVFFIEQLLKDAKLSVTDLDAIVVTQGPGSYSGIRGSLATAKTLAQTLLIPVVGVSTLEAMAYGVDGEEIFVILDACLNQFNVAKFKKVTEGYRRLLEDEVIDTNEVMARLKKVTPETVVVFSEKVQKDLPEVKAVIGYPKGESVARIGLARIQSGEIQSLFAVQPKYSHHPNIRQFPGA
ncbi:MAG: tRNA (adenosine(37)-N6)-threonylcarbamoyltransferase complex dimerization subunit type 1 TsaB [Candidatus Saganbacteria bacterium]|nr:tRNA (adenosine(37)-N6)-threonylcarbamoyltransferase complex dimerization subunit type 1 TsaB [Candidatus Saganbacteria bacterium]